MFFNDASSKTLFFLNTKFQELAVVVHACNPSTRETEAEVSSILGQSKLDSRTRFKKKGLTVGGRWPK
jgi:hypothetical protein